jgi:hypothetical protein
MFSKYFDRGICCTFPAPPVRFRSVARVRDQFTVVVTLEPGKPRARAQVKLVRTKDLSLFNTEPLLRS